MPKQFEGMNEGRSPRQVIFPKYDDVDARAAASAPDEGINFLDARERRFMLLNPIEGATEESAQARGKAVQLKQELAALEKQIAWTAPTIVRASEATPPTTAALASV